jgi:hypothetical protein
MRLRASSKTRHEPNHANKAQVDVTRATAAPPERGSSRAHRPPGPA